MAVNYPQGSMCLEVVELEQGGRYETDDKVFVGRFYQNAE